MFATVGLLLQDGAAIQCHIEARLQEVHALVGRRTVLVLDPVLEGADEGVGEEVRLEVDVLVVSQNALDVVVDEGMEETSEMIRERVLTVEFQHFAVKFTVVIEVLNGVMDTVPSVGIICLHVFFYKFRVEDPVDEVVFVPEVVVETGPVHFAAVTDLSDSDFAVGQFPRKLLQSGGEGPFCNHRICHNIPPQSSV